MFLSHVDPCKPASKFFVGLPSTTVLLSQSHLTKIGQKTVCSSKSLHHFFSMCHKSMILCALESYGSGDYFKLLQLTSGTSRKVFKAFWSSGAARPMENGYLRDLLNFTSLNEKFEFFEKIKNFHKNHIVTPGALYDILRIQSERWRYVETSLQKIILSLINLSIMKRSTVI